MVAVFSFAVLASCAAALRVSASESIDPALVEAEAFAEQVSQPSSAVITDLKPKSYGEQANDVSYKQATKAELGKLLSHYYDQVKEHQTRIDQLQANLTAARTEKDQLKATADDADAVAKKSMERFFRLQRKLEGLMLRLQGWAITNLRHQARVLLNVDPSRFNATETDEFRRMRRFLERASFELRESYNFLLKIVRAVEDRNDMHIFGEAPNQKEVDAAVIELARVDLEMGAMESIRNRTLIHARNLRDELRKQRKYMLMYGLWSQKTRHILDQVNLLLQRGLLEARLHPEYPPVDDCPEYLNGSVCVPKPADVNVRVKVHVNISKDGNSTVTLLSSNEPECTDLNSDKCQKSILALNGKMVNNTLNLSPPPTAFPEIAPLPPVPPKPTEIVHPPHPFNSNATGVRRYSLDGYCVFPNDKACTLNDLSVAVGVHIDRDGTPRLIVGARSNVSTINKNAVPGVLPPHVQLPYIPPPPPLPPPRAGIPVLPGENNTIPASALLSGLQATSAQLVGPKAGVPAAVSRINEAMFNPATAPSINQTLYTNHIASRYIRTVVTPINGTDGRLYVRVQRMVNSTNETILDQTIPLNLTAKLAWGVVNNLLKEGKIDPTRYFNLPGSRYNSSSKWMNVNNSYVYYPYNGPVSPAKVVAAPPYAFGSDAINVLLPTNGNWTTENTTTTVVNRPAIPPLAGAAAVAGRKLVTTQRVVTIRRKRKDGQYETQTRVFTDVKDITPSPPGPATTSYPVGLEPNGPFDNGGNLVTTALGDMVVGKKSLTYADRAAISERLNNIQQSIDNSQLFNPPQIPAGTTTSSNQLPYTNGQPVAPVVGSAARFRGNNNQPAASNNNNAAKPFFESGVSSQSKPSSVSAATPRVTPSASQSLDGRPGSSETKNLTPVKASNNNNKQQNSKEVNKAQESKTNNKNDGVLSNDYYKNGPVPVMVSPSSLPADPVRPYRTDDNNADIFSSSSLSSGSLSALPDRELRDAVFDPEEDESNTAAAVGGKSQKEANRKAKKVPQDNDDEMETEAGHAELKMNIDNNDEDPDAVAMPSPATEQVDSAEAHAAMEMAFLQLSETPKQKKQQQPAKQTPPSKSANNNEKKQQVQQDPQQYVNLGYTNVEQEMRLLHSQWQQQSKAADANAKASVEKQYSEESSEESSENSEDRADARELGELLDETTAKLPASLYKHIAKVAVNNGRNMDKVTAYEPKESFLSSKIAPAARDDMVVVPSRARPAKKEQETVNVIDVKRFRKQLAKKLVDSESSVWARDSGEVDDGEDASEAGGSVDHDKENKKSKHKHFHAEKAELSGQEEEEGDEIDPAMIARLKEAQEAEDSDEVSEESGTAAAAPAASQPAVANPKRKGPFDKHVMRGKPLAIDKKLARLEPILSKMQPTVNHDYSLHSHGHFPRVRPSKKVLKKAEKELKKMKAGKKNARLAAPRLPTEIATAPAGQTVANSLMKKAYEKIVKPQVTAKMVSSIKHAPAAGNQKKPVSQQPSAQPERPFAQPAPLTPIQATNGPLIGEPARDPNTPVAQLVSRLATPLPSNETDPAVANSTEREWEWDTYDRARTRVDAPPNKVAPAIITWDTTVKVIQHPSPKAKYVPVHHTRVIPKPHHHHHHVGGSYFDITEAWTGAFKGRVLPGDEPSVPSVPIVPKPAVNVVPKAPAMPTPFVNDNSKVNMTSLPWNPYAKPPVNRTAINDTGNDYGLSTSDRVQNQAKKLEEINRLYNTTIGNIPAPPLVPPPPVKKPTPPVKQNPTNAWPAVPVADAIANAFLNRTANSTLARRTSNRSGRRRSRLSKRYSRRSRRSSRRARRNRRRRANRWSLTSSLKRRYGRRNSRRSRSSRRRYGEGSRRSRRYRRRYGEGSRRSRRYRRGYGEHTENSRQYGEYSRRQYGENTVQQQYAAHWQRQYGENTQQPYAAALPATVAATPAVYVQQRPPQQLVSGQPEHGQAQQQHTVSSQAQAQAHTLSQASAPASTASSRAPSAESSVPLRYQKRTPSGVATHTNVAAVPDIRVVTPNDDGSFVSKTGKVLKPVHVEGKRWHDAVKINKMDRDGLIINRERHAEIVGKPNDISSQIVYPHDQQFVIRQGPPATTYYFNPQPSRPAESSQSANLIHVRFVEAQQKEEENDALPSSQPREEKPTLLSRLFARLHQN